MATPRAQINLAVEGADEGRRRIESVADALRRVNDQSLQRLSGQIGGLNDRIAGLQSTFGNIASYSIAGVSLAAFGAKINGVLDSLGQLDDLAQKSGASVERLSQIQKVAKAFGVDFGTVDAAVVKLARGLTTIDEKSSKTQRALAAIGVSAKDSAGKLRDPSEVMVDVAKSLQQYEDGASKAALVTDLFGKSGADLLPFFNDLAENVDSFSAVSKEAAADASALQDKIGLLGTRTDEVFTAITTAALPGLTALADGFSDVLNAEDGLVNSGELSEWADDIAVGLARVADVAVLLPRLFSAVSGSVKVVAADVSVLWAATPANMAYKLAKGGSPLEDLKKEIAERSRVLDAANKKYDELWNKPANQFEQAVLKRISNRVGDATPIATGNNPGKVTFQTLAYSSGGDDDAKDAERQADAYKTLTAAIREKIVQSRAELTVGKPVNAARQEQIKLDEALASGKLKLTPIQKAQVGNLLEELNTNLEVIESKKRAAEGLEGYNKIRDEYETRVSKNIQDAVSEAERNEELAATYGKTRSEIAALQLTRLEEQLNQRSSLGLTLDEIENLEKLIAAKKRSSVALAQVDSLENGKKALDDLNSFLDPARAESFGEALREALGGAGTALSALTASLDGFSRRQAEIAKQRENAALAFRTGQQSEFEYMQALSRLNEKETKNRLSGYGDMANAAAGFFGEQSRGYQTLMTVSKVFHAAELAMTMAELVPKAISAVLTQGTGDPYTAFGRMAAMTALVAGLGVAIGGGSGGGVNRTESRQKTQGTGTVLGSDAKSESIARSLDQIEQATIKNLSNSIGMLTSLRNIEAGIDRFASLLVRTTGVTGDFGSELGKNVFDSKAIGIGGAAVGGLAGAAAGAYIGMGTSQIGMLLGGPVGMALGAILGAVIGKTFIGKALGKVFGGKQTVEDTGFSVEKADFASIFAGGLNAMQYADIKKDGGWFGKDKYSTKTEGLGEEGNRQIAGVLTSLYDSVFEAGKLLGLGTDDFSARLSRFVVDIGKVSLKGLSDDEIQKELQSVFSKVGDELAQFGIGGLEQFQKVGEGYLETLARVASNYAGLDALMASIGRTVGAAGIESLAARERLINLAGGIGELSERTDSFAQEFLSEAERLAPVQKYVSEQLASMGLASVSTREQFKQVVLGLDVTTEAGAKQYTALMSLADAFAEVYPKTEDLTKSMQEIADERKDLQGQLDELTMTSAELLAKQRNALDESNRALFDQIQAIKAATTAEEERAAVAGDLLGGLDSAFSALQRVVGREKALLQDRIGKEQELISRHQALSSSLRSALESMSSPEAGLSSRQDARAQLQAALANAKAGGALPDADDLKSALSILSKDASDIFATQQDYLRDFYTTQNDIAALAGVTDQSLSVEERSLAQLEKQLASLDAIVENGQEQIDALKGQSVATLTLAQAMAALSNSIGAVKANPIASSGGSIAGLYKELLGRAPDAAGLAFYKEKMAGGLTLDEIRKAMMTSDEYESKQMKGVPGFANGGDFGGGFRIVGERTPELEFTGPSRIVAYEQFMQRLTAPSNVDPAILTELRELRAEVTRLREANSNENYHIAKYTLQSADYLDSAVNGEKPIATKVVTE